MKLLYKINLILLIVLSLATGVFKILRQEADIELFKVLGMTATLTFGLGIVQVLGGLLLIPVQTRKYGALLMMATFVLASLAVFMNGMVVFGLVSLLFILMTFWVYQVEKKNT
ncbi:DoxX family protein [Ulvibacterium marinum]|uniref:DoxX family protein n=1 Tax=Ulvibacterium marinum TaxID=2419782 RepID=UPI002494343D|nr:DoxX family protein [Ulvibacterium marinum]